MKINTKKLIEDLIHVKDIIGEPPSREEYKKHGKYGISTIVRRFGNWNSALNEVFGKVRNSSPQGVINKKCDNPKCGMDIEIPKSAEREYNFCSQKCSATFLNHIYKKRKLAQKCRKCKSLINKRRTYCEMCFTQMHEEFKGRTIKELIYKEGSNKYGSVRRYTRVVTSTRKQECEKCGYNKHVQTCHIKPISSFSDDTKLEVVNAENNLILLCPNCHWELDHL